MDFLSKLCVGFDWKRVPNHDKEYLYDMYRTIKFNHKCPKTNEIMDNIYPNRGNFKLFLHQEKMERYIDSSPNRNEVYSSHLLNGRKYHLVWTCDHIEN